MITSETNSISYSGNGVTTTFAYTFPIQSNTWVKVYVDGVLKTLTTHYSVTGVGGSGGNIVFVTAPGNLSTVLIARTNIPITQLLDYVQGDSFPAESHESGLDKFTSICQQLWYTATRSLKLPAYESNSMTLLPASGRANTVLAFDESGDLSYETLPSGTPGDTFLQTGTGATERTFQNKTREIVSVKDFGAVGDGTTDDSAAIQKAINLVITNGAIKVIFPTASYKVLTKILVPSYVTIEGQGSTLTGSGYTTGDNNMFESGYIDSGAIITNIGTANETCRVINTVIRGFKIVNCYKAFNLKNFNEGCEVADIGFTDCYYSILAARSFYSRYVNLMSRGTAGGVTNAAYEFNQFVNVVEFQSVFVEGRVLGWKFTGGINGLSVRNCGAENLTTGMLILGEVNPMNIDSVYFEGISGTAIDLTDTSAKRAITIDNNWFFGCGTGIAGVQLLSGKLGAGNYFASTTNPVTISDNLTSYITVEIPTSIIADNGSLTPALPSGYTIGTKCRLVHEAQIYNNSTGALRARANNDVDRFVQLPWTGNCATVTSDIPYCSNSKTAGTTFDVIVDTKITYGLYVAGIFALTINDNVGAYYIAGRWYGTTALLDVNAGSKTLAVSNNGGYVRLTFGSFSHPSSTYSLSGLVRIV